MQVYLIISLSFYEKNINNENHYHQSLALSVNAVKLDNSKESFKSED